MKILRSFASLVSFSVLSFFLLQSPRRVHSATVESTSSSLSTDTLGNSAQGELLYVQVLHRHGDRSPVHVNPASSKEWAELGLEPGQLTNKGANMLYALGQLLREEYVEKTGFLPPHHPGGRVHVRSTDVDRCLNSVHSLLDALYPHILIPVHTIPQEQEKLLQPTDKCPSFLVSYRPTLHQMDDIAEKRFNTAKSNVLPRLKNITGWGDTLLAANLLTIATDNIICAEAHNLHIPEELEQLKETIFGFTKFIYYHKFVARLDDPRSTVGAYLLKHMLRQMQYKVLALEGRMTLAPSSKPTHIRVESEILQHRRERLSAESAANKPKNNANHHNKNDHSPSTSTSSSSPSASRVKWRRRKRYESHRGIQRVVEERLRIYSAHDSTIIALMSALRLIEDDQSEYLLPHYASSVHIELRKRDGLYWVNAFYGYPVVDENNEDHYQYTRHPIMLRCPGQSSHGLEHEDPREARKAWSCPLSSFEDFVHAASEPPRPPGYISTSQTAVSALSSNGMPMPSFSIAAQIFAADYEPSSMAYPPGDGCCVVTDAFKELGCEHVEKLSDEELDDDGNARREDDASSIAANRLRHIHSGEALNTASFEEECLMFRQRCPFSACGEGNTVDPVTLKCIPGASTSSSFFGFGSSTHNRHSFVADLWLFFFGFLCICVGAMVSYAYLRVYYEDKHGWDSGLGYRDDSSSRQSLRDHPDGDGTEEGDAEDAHMQQHNPQRMRERGVQAKLLSWISPLFHGSSGARKKNELLMA